MENGSSWLLRFTRARILPAAKSALSFIRTARSRHSPDMNSTYRATLNVLFLSSFAFLAACGGASTSVPGAPDASPNEAAHADSRNDTGTQVPDSPPGDTSRPRTGSIAIHLKATTSPFTHHDAWASQTPSDQRIGIRSLSLGSSADDPSPWVVFDLGTKTVDAGLNDGDDTLVAAVPASSVKTGSYAYARVGVAYVRYAVAATVHVAGLALTGTFHNLEVLSNDTVIGGQTYASGYYSFAFVVGSQTYGPVTGTSAPLPESAGLGIALSIQGGEATYGFPVALEVPQTSASVDLTMLANTSEDFRWMDENESGYASGVFDVTPPSSYEPVKQFGANSLTLSVAVKP